MVDSGDEIASEAVENLPGGNESYGDADLFGKKMFLTTSLIRRETFRENLFSKTQISGQLSGRAGH